MKNVLLLMFGLMIFSSTLFAQISRQNYTGEETFKIGINFDIDSATTLTSEQFSLDNFDGALSSNPATFYFDFDRDALPASLFNMEIIVYGIYNGTSYTFPLDTVIAHKVNQGVDDSLGVLTFNKWSADAYYITIDNDGGNASGLLKIIFPKREFQRVSELGSTN